MSSPSRTTVAAVSALALTVPGLVLADPAGSAAAADRAAQRPAPAGSAAASRATDSAAAPGAAASDAAAGGIRWGSCTSASLQAAHAQCGYLSVPLDHRRPGGRQIQLAVSRVRHTVPQAQYQGVMLVNPGGPGGSGLTLATLGRYVPKHAGDAYDWIGFDPRGVGSSRPALSCLPHYFGPDRPDYVPTALRLERVWRERSARYAAACGRRGGELLDHLKTVDSARDMDAIRGALGVRRINYYGFSYGTYLAQVYATLFPTHLRRVVLDSNVDPRKVWYRANLDQDLAFDRNIGIFFGWVAEHDATYHLGRTRRAVENLFYAEQDRLRRFPAGGVVGPDEWVDAFLGAGYVQFVWPSTAEVFARWVHHRDAAPLVAAYRDADSPGDDNGFAVYNAVQCTDVQWPQSWATWRRDNWRVYEKAPFETWANAWFNAPCLTWPAKAGTPVHVDGGAAPPALLLGETLDAATPFAGNLEVRRRFPKARLLAVVGGTTHAGSLYGNACEDDRIADYLLTGALPRRKAGDRPDVTCPALPQPQPQTSVAQLQPRSVPAGVPSRLELGLLTRR